MSGATATTGGVRRRLPSWEKLSFPVAIAAAAMLPFIIDTGGGFMGAAIIALAYVVMALGLNIIVGFAGLLDLGYVAFFAIGAYTVGYFGSRFLAPLTGDEGIYVWISDVTNQVPGIHMNFLLILLAAVVFTTVAGVLIGLPTLRLRGDYIAIVTLAFGEIIHQIAINGNQITIGNFQLTNGRQGIQGVDTVNLPLLEPFPPPLLELQNWYWLALALVAVTLFVNFRLRESRLGRAWIALREDEVAAVSMGIPMVKTKLLAYGTGAAFGGMAGAFLGSYLTVVNADQFQFSFSIFVLAMVILGGLGSIWGVVIGAILLSVLNNFVIPRLNSLPDTFGLDFDLTQVSAGIFGFLLVVMMVLRPEGLLPERRRRAEMKEALEAEEALAMERDT